MNTHQPDGLIARQSLSGLLETLKPTAAKTLDLQRYVSIFRRRQWTFSIVAAVVFVLAIVITLYMQISRPLYTAAADVILDQHKQTVVNSEQVMGDLPSDPFTVDTEVEVLESRDLAEKVDAALNLDRDPFFNAEARPPGLLRPIKRAVTGAIHNAIDALTGKQEPSEALKQQITHEKVIDLVLKHLKVTRSGLTYVIEIGYQANDPQKAALIANTYADKYLLEQLDAKFDATERANQWLNSRLAGLRDQVVDAEAQVERYKAANGLLSAEGNTLTEQEISNLNNQLAATKAQEAEQVARLNTAQNQLAKGSTGDDVGEALNSQVIQQLRAQRAEVSRQVADLEARYGPRHPELLRAKGQLTDIDGQIQAEIKRVISNLQAQAQVARQRTASIESSLSQSKGTLVANNSASVKLNELERNAESARTLYQSFLDRFKQTSAQQGIEQSDSRVISRAKLPTKLSSPVWILNLALGLVGAVGVGFGSILLLEMFENRLFTSDQVETLFSLPDLGAIPMLASTITDKTVSRSRLSPTNYVVERPLSAFSEAFRNLRAAIAMSKTGEQSQVIAITSSFPGEGKSTTSICLARVIAMAGASVVVVDCDLRRRAINLHLGLQAKAGLLEVLSGACSLEAGLVKDQLTNAYFLTASAEGASSPRDVFSGAAMDRLLQHLRQRFDIILLDTAPVLAVADTRIIAPKADTVLLLARWRKTAHQAVEKSIKMLQFSGAQIGGVALTQVDMREQARSGYGDVGYYSKEYRDYYTE
jgi:exopolysaccharide transport family protein